MAEQSDLFRLLYVVESLKGMGWQNFVLSKDEWATETSPDFVADSYVVMVERENLHASLMRRVKDILVEICVLGSIAEVAKLLDAQHYHCNISLERSNNDLQSPSH